MLIQISVFRCVVAMVRKLMALGAVSLMIPAQAQFVKVGTCKPAVDWGFPDIHTLGSAFGKIYMGYGDWNAHPGPVILTSYDPKTGVVTAEHSLATDSIGAFREIGGKLYIPSIDPIHYQHFEDYVAIHPDGHLESRTPGGFFHAFDMFERTEGEIWIVGSMGPNEWNNDGAAVMRSVDGGITWENFTPSSSEFRFYWGFELGGRAFAHGETFGDAGWSLNNLPFNIASETVKVTTDSGSVVCLVDGESPGFGVSRTGGRLFVVREDGSNERLTSTVRSLAEDGGKLYVLLRSGDIRIYDDVVAAPESFSLFEWKSPVHLSSIHVLDGVVYGGAINGDLYAAKLDGGALPTHEMTFRDELPERAGEDIRILGNMMAVGIPHSSQTIFGELRLQAGRVEVYTRASNVDLWEFQQEVTSPFGFVAEEGAWFGTSVDFSDTRLLITAEGVSKNGERGEAARLYSFERREGRWWYEADTEIPYQQTARVVDDRVVATVLADLLNFESHAFEQPSQGYAFSDFYEPYAVLDLDPNDTSRVYRGLTADVSRGGGHGEVRIFDTMNEGLSTVQLIESPAPGRDRFGFSLDVRGKLLVVGAPRSDVSVLQGGAAFIYRRDDAGVMQFEELVSADDATFEAGFGHAIAVTEDERIWISAPFAETPYGKRGAVYVFEKEGDTWTQIAKLTPDRSDTKIWEFGETVEPDGNSVVVASGQANDALPVLKRLKILSLAPSYSTWTRSQGLGGDDALPEAEFPGFAISNLEAYALRSHEGDGPQVVKVDGGTELQFRRRVGIEHQAPAYVAEFSVDLENWNPLPEGNAEAESYGWERVRVPLPIAGGFVRISLSLVE